MAPLGRFDWQISDDMIDGTVNTGFFHLVSNEDTIAHWKGVLEMDMKEASRDQRNTNILLGTQELRPKVEQHDGFPYADAFVSKKGISVKVIPSEVSRHMARTIGNPAEMVIVRPYMRII